MRRYRGVSEDVAIFILVACAIAMFGGCSMWESSLNHEYRMEQLKHQPTAKGVE